MCPKSIRRFYSEFPWTLEFSDGFQNVLVSLEAIRLPQELRSTDLILAGWLTSRKRPVVFVGIRHFVVLDIRTIIVVVVVGIGSR